MTFQAAASSGIVWAVVACIITYVMAISVLYLRRSWARAKELGITRAELMTVVKSTVSYSFVPSVAILIGLFGLAAMVGVPWGWYRLSVLGSVGYEIMAADTALRSIGKGVADAFAADFVLVAFVMSICILGGLIAAILFAKRLQAGTLKLKERDRRWGALGNSTFLLTILVVFAVPMLLPGGVSLLTFATSALVTVILGLAARATKAKWLSEFILAIALLAAMASSVLWTNLLK